LDAVAKVTKAPSLQSSKVAPAGLHLAVTTVFDAGLFLGYCYLFSQRLLKKDELHIRDSVEVAGNAHLPFAETGTYIRLMSVLLFLVQFLR